MSLSPISMAILLCFLIVLVANNVFVRSWTVPRSQGTSTSRSRSHVCQQRLMLQQKQQQLLPLQRHSSATSPITTALPPPAARHMVALQMTEEESLQTTPTSFREAEILGLRFMQEGRFKEALDTFQNGMKLPGSRPDIIRTKLTSGPSPVGGAMGGLESQKVYTLDEFEYQAAFYNMACAHAQLGNLDEAIGNLKQAFQSGFDNYATVRGDPDLKPIQDTTEFQDLMDQYDKKKGLFNPFGFFS